MREAALSKRSLLETSVKPVLDRISTRELARGTKDAPRAKRVTFPSFLPTHLTSTHVVVPPLVLVAANLHAAAR